MQRSTLRHLALALGLTLGLAALCLAPAQAWGGEAGLLALGLGALVSLLGACFGHGVGALVGRLDASPEAGPRAVQAATAARLVGTLFLAIPPVVLAWAPPMQFAVWLGVQYLGQLGLEVFVSMRALRQNHPPTEAAAPSPRQHEETAPARDASTSPASKDPGAPEG